jgi:CheY-like chemotaxis protein
MRVLVVEDYRDTAHLFRLLLRSVGMIDIAATVDEALEKTQVTQYDLLIVDIQLGEKRTGVDLLYTLREDPRYAAVPIVACTARVEAEHKVKILAHGFNGFIGKPFTKDQLLKEIARLCPSESAQISRS